MKKIISLLLVISLCTSLIVPAFAVSNEKNEEQLITVSQEVTSTDETLPDAEGNLPDASLENETEELPADETLPNVDGSLPDESLENETEGLPADETLPDTEGNLTDDSLETETEELPADEALPDTEGNLTDDSLENETEELPADEALPDAEGVISDESSDIDLGNILGVIANGIPVDLADIVIVPEKATLVDELIGNQTRTAPGAENTAPVAGLQLFCLNAEESMQNNQYTTTSQFFFAWRWNGIDYTFDVDGDPLDLYLDGVPSEYMQFLSDPNGQYEGVAVVFEEPGYYPFEFYAIDPSGEMSNIVEGGLAIFPFEAVDDAIQGEFTSVTDTQTHLIAVDFTSTPEFVIGAVRSGTTMFDVNVTDEGGNAVGEELDLKRYGRDSIKITQSGGNAQQTYTVTLTPTTFVSGDSGYRIVSGNYDDLPELFSGRNNIVGLETFTNFVDNNYRPSGSAIQECIPGSEGNWYHYVTNDLEETTFHLSSNTSNILRFKIYDESNNMLFDSDTGGNNYEYTDYGTVLVSKGTFTLAAGTAYDIQVYAKDSFPTVSDGRYYIAIGEPTLNVNTLEFDIPSRSVVDGAEYIQSVTIDVPTGVDAYIAELNVSAGSSYEYSFDYRGPTDYSWKYGGYSTKRFPLPSVAELIDLDGTWDIKLEGKRTGTSGTGTIKMLYFDVR